MRTLYILALTTCLAAGSGCGYSSKNGMTASSAPVISELAPNDASAGGPAFTLTVNGSKFVNGAVVYWNGATRATRFVSPTQVTASISATDIADNATVSVLVKNPGGTGIYSNQPGQSSNPMSFTVNP